MVKPVNQALENKSATNLFMVLNGALAYKLTWVIRTFINGLKVTIMHRYHCRGLSNITSIQRTDENSFLQ